MRANQGILDCLASSTERTRGIFWQKNIRAIQNSLDLIEYK